MQSSIQLSVSEAVDDNTRIRKVVSQWSASQTYSMVVLLANHINGKFLERFVEKLRVVTMRVNTCTRIKETKTLSAIIPLAIFIKIPVGIFKERTGVLAVILEWSSWSSMWLSDSSVNLKYNRVHYRKAIYKWHPPSPTTHVLSCTQATCAFTRSEPYQPLKLYLSLPTFVCVNIFWKRYTYCITNMFSGTYALIASVSFVL